MLYLGGLLLLTVICWIFTSWYDGFNTDYILHGIYNNKIKVCSFKIKPEDCTSRYLVFFFSNRSGKTIKYMTATFGFINTVGDCINTCRCRTVGPIYNNRKYGGTWKCPSFLPKISHTKIISYEIEYMDGTYEIIKSSL